MGIAHTIGGRVPNEGAYDSAPVDEMPHELSVDGATEIFAEHPKQAEFARAILSGDYKYLATGGAVGGGKSTGTINSLFALCAIFPGSRWAITRKDLPTMRRTTIPTIAQIRPSSFVGELNQSSWSYTCTNGSQVVLFPESIKGDPHLRRFSSFECNGFLAEEANELDRKTFSKMIERAGRWKIRQTPAQRERQREIDELLALRKREKPSRVRDAAIDALTSERAALQPVQPPPLILLTFNPDDNWIRDVFYDPFMAGTLKAPYYFLPTTAKDNPSLPQAYLDSLEELKESDPIAYRRFVLGDWGAITEPNQLIETKWVVDARTTPLIDGPMREGLDVARYGDDEIVFARVRGNALIELSTYPNRRDDPHILYSLSVYAGNRMIAAGIDPAMYTVDSVGMGGGVVDNLVAKRFNVQSFEAGGKPIERVNEKARALKKDDEYFDRTPHSFLKFKDLRSQAWYEFAQKLRRGEIHFAETHPKLIKDLTAVHYEIRGDRVLKVESKDDIKGRLKRSTDYGDAVVMAFFDWPKHVTVSYDPADYARSRR